MGPARRRDRDVAESPEEGLWHYLVTDPAGIRARKEPSYGSAKDGARVPGGAVLRVRKRRRCGWTRWLCLEGEWIFDISPKDRKVRAVEVEVQTGHWRFEVCVPHLELLASPVGKATGAFGLGDCFYAEEKVRPVVGKGAFLKVVGEFAWAGPAEVGGRWDVAGISLGCRTPKLGIPVTGAFVLLAFALSTAIPKRRSRALRAPKRFWPMAVDFLAMEERREPALGWSGRLDSWIRRVPWLEKFHLAGTVVARHDTSADFAAYVRALALTSALPQQGDMGRAAHFDELAKFDELLSLWAWSI
ncbi:unnamed protein product [Effrenium voratum]|uniref:Uncharacterized protein n=1 Tax=Effrenium voratum TaxID=2562239 RepID=A0AA36HVQ1_9DINO|nr:unnamed protein product [Effrenium voratum]